tara:strand:- start:2989 stop:3180 length:192 start_codon:yes stop_codon:yes gene_type:complete
MAAMSLSGLTAASLGSKMSLPKRSGLKARAGKTVQMQPMGASKRAAVFSPAAVAPTPGAPISR